MESLKYKITVISHSKTTGHTTYIIKIEKDNKSITFSERYSNLKSFHDSLKKETNNNALPKFPPKKFFGSEDEKFLIKRQQELNNYFEALCSSDEFTSLPAFKKFIENAKNTGKNTTNTPQIEQPKKIQEIQSNEINTKVSKEIKNSKNTEEEYSKIVEEYVKKYIDMGYAAEQEINEENEKKYLKLFSEVKFEGGNNEIDKNINKESKIEAGNDDNFNLIGNEDSSVTELKNNIKQKMENVLKEYKTLEDVYNTSKLIVPI